MGASQELTQLIRRNVYKQLDLRYEFTNGMNHFSVLEALINWVRYFLTAIVAIPAAAIVTIVLAPAWRWFESTAGIESYGHSGPATWCYLAVYIVLLIVGTVLAIYGSDGDE